MSFRRSPFPGPLLALGVLILICQRPPGCAAQEADQAKAAKAAVKKLAAIVAAGKEISEEEVKKFVKDHDDLEDVMSVFKPERRGQPSLDVVLGKLAKKKTFTAAEKAQLLKIAYLSRAVASVTPHYAGKIDADKKKAWDKYNSEMDAWSVDVIEGIKAGQDKAIARALPNLSASCTDCHTVARPGPPPPPRFDGEPVELIGRATEAWFAEKDFTFLVKDEATGKTWRIISREPTPAYIFRMGTTFPGLKVDWKSKPRVKVMAVEGNDRIPAKFHNIKLAGTRLATALVVFVEIKPKVWKEFYVNNWFHRWSANADNTVHHLYAGKKAPYDVYGFVRGQAAPFTKKAQAIIAKNKDNPSLMFHGRILATKDNEFGYEIELIDLIGRDVRTSGHIMLHGDGMSIPLIDGKKPGK